MANDLEPVELTAIDTTTQEWIGFPIPQLGVELTAMPLRRIPERTTSSRSCSSPTR